MESILPPKLEVIPEHKSTSLGILRQRYGERLRIAAEPDAIFAAITGTHIRVRSFYYFCPLQYVDPSFTVPQVESYGIFSSANNHKGKRWRSVRSGSWEAIWL